MTNTREINVNALVGELVHQYMWRNKVTQTAIANALGVGQPAIARKLRGERPFSVDELLAVAEFLNVAITEFLPNAGSPHQGGPDGGGNADNGLKVRSSNHLSYRGSSDDTNIVPMRRGAVAA